MATIKAHIGTDRYRTVLKTATNNITADEPVSNGGADTGFSPSELLISALGACTCITLRMYADRKTWPLLTVDVDITFERDQERNVSNIHRQISLTGDLSEEQKSRLLKIADQCYVHKILSNPIHITSALA